VSDEPAHPWPPWYAPLALVLGLIVGAFGTVLVESFAHAGGASLTNIPPGINDAATLVQDLCFVAAAVFLAARVAPVSRAQFGLRTGRALWKAVLAVLLGLGVFYGLSYAWFALLQRSGAERGLVNDLGGNGGTLEILAACAVICVVAPICEEILFRGFIYRALRNWRGPWPAAVITGILFGLVHGASAPAIDLLPLAVFGVMLSALYEWTGSLYPCIALHALNNSLAFGSDEGWAWRIVELVAGSLLAIAVVLAIVEFAGRRLPQSRRGIFGR